MEKEKTKTEDSLIFLEPLGNIRADSYRQIRSTLPSKKYNFMQISMDDAKDCVSIFFGHPNACNQMLIIFRFGFQLSTITVDGRFLASRSKTETVSSKMTMALI
jgi:hypothetical protein